MLENKQDESEKIYVSLKCWYGEIAAPKIEYLAISIGTHLANCLRHLV